MLVREAGTTISDVVDNARRVNDIVSEMMAAFREQADGIGQVNAAVGQLDQMTQQNAALVEQSAAAATSLQDQARRLLEIVAVFDIGARREADVLERRAALPPPAARAPAKKAPAKLTSAPVKAVAAPAGPAKRIAAPAAAAVPAKLVPAARASAAPAPAKKPVAERLAKPAVASLPATAAADDGGEWTSF